MTQLLRIFSLYSGFLYDCDVGINGAEGPPTLNQHRSDIILHRLDVRFLLKTHKSLSWSPLLYRKPEYCNDNEEIIFAHIFLTEFMMLMWLSSLPVHSFDIVAEHSISLWTKTHPLTTYGEAVRCLELHRKVKASPDKSEMVCYLFP